MQLLHAHKDIGGATIVIMTETPKLELEEWFRCAGSGLVMWKSQC